MKSETASMKIKSYFSHSVEQAIQEARQQLGPEAVLITSRRAAPHDRHLGAYEVVFGSTAPAPEPTPAPQDLNREVAALRDQMESIKRALAAGAALPNAGAQPEHSRLQQQLIDAGLDATVAQQIAEDASIAARDLPAAQRPAGLESLALQSIRKRLRFSSELAADTPGAKRAIVVVGPPGAGKTTALAKIAVGECLGRRLSARILSVDPYRVAAHEKLRTLAKIMGLGFTSASTIREFLDAVDEFRGKDVLLIDTPGFSSSEFESLQELASCLARINARETHLVLPAWMSRKDLMRYADLYAGFQPDYVLFTKLDETESPSACLGAALEIDRPLSYFSTGQGIPEDIQPASADPLLAALFGQRAAAISAA